MEEIGCCCHCCCFHCSVGCPHMNTYGFLHSDETVRFPFLSISILLRFVDVAVNYHRDHNGKSDE